ncbi:MAG: ABC transporter ATP-binding protein [Microbacteriaceae bacterium]|nr:ABC transporter ATP-binding protein [Microbacteriaceae bacterium]
MSEIILKVENLQASVSGQQVVEDVSFEVPAVGITALLGRNGVGKSSTIKGILGLYQRQGNIIFDGQPIQGLLTHQIVQLGIGYVPEDREIFSKLSVEENLRIAERDKNPNRRYVAELFPDIEARKAQTGGSLSGGQQQMVSLARALINSNKLLLVDEPTKGLAPKIVTEVAVALEEASKTVPMLLVEQNLEVVRRLAEDVIVLDAGKVVYTGKAKTLLADEALTQRLLGVHSEGA